MASRRGFFGSFVAGILGAATLAQASEERVEGVRILYLNGVAVREGKDFEVHSGGSFRFAFRLNRGDFLLLPYVSRNLLRTVTIEIDERVDSRSVVDFKGVTVPPDWRIAGPTLSP